MFYIKISDGGAGPWSYILDVSVEGLPDGIPFKKPSCYGVQQLRAILGNQEQLNIKGKALMCMDVLQSKWREKVTKLSGATMTIAYQKTII